MLRALSTSIIQHEKSKGEASESVDLVEEQDRRSGAVIRYLSTHNKTLTSATCGTLQTHCPWPEEKIESSMSEMARSLVDIRDAHRGFAETSGGAPSEMSSDSGNCHATQAVRITLWHALDPNVEGPGGDGVHNMATGSFHSFCARSLSHSTAGQVLNICQ